jgi:hypothetical protein
VWGAGFSVLGFGLFSVLRLTGVLTRGNWVDGLGLAARMGIVGFVAGAAFSSVIRLVYHGRRLRDINWIRFGIAGGIATGVFVPLFLQAMNVLTGGPMVPWRLVLDDGIWATVFGAIAAGGSLKLAQRADAANTRKRQDQLDEADSLDRLPAGLEDRATKQSSRSTRR